MLTQELQRKWDRTALEVRDLRKRHGGYIGVRMGHMVRHRGRLLVPGHGVHK